MIQYRDMVDEHIDVAHLLSITAGKHLSEAYQFHLKMTHKQHTNEEYFSLRADEREACIEAVILFQASMEAMINEELENEPQLKKIKLENDNLHKKFKMLSFKNKWQKAFDALHIDAQEKQYLHHYVSFYLKFRVPITHATSRYVDAEKFNFPNVYKGIKSGYLAIECFYKRLGKFTQEHTWQRFAQVCALPI